MSAFILDDACWRKIVDLLHDPDPHGCTILARLTSMLEAAALAADPTADFPGLTAQRVIAAWHQANVLAVNSRYQGRVCIPMPSAEPSKEAQQRLEEASFRRDIRKEDPDRLVGYIKLMQCLMYQCAEDVPACDQAEHTEAMESMLLVIAALGSRLATSLPVYEKLPWGAAA